MKKQLGITLIELLIVLLIVGVLSAVALPNFNQHSLITQRNYSQNNLYQLQIWLEQQYTINASYPQVLNCSYCQLSDEYDFSISITEDETLYRLVATPKATSKQNNDQCYSMVIDGLSQQSNSDHAGEDITNKQCWR